MGRMLGLDYGDVRVGVAITDPCRIICSPHTVLSRVTDDLVADEVVKLCEEKQVDQLVVGLPLNMDGSAGDAARKVEAFVEILESKTDISIALWDERLSTVSAQKSLIAAGTRRDKRKGLVDKVAAQIILQNYMESLEFPGSLV